MADHVKADQVTVLGRGFHQLEVTSDQRAEIADLLTKRSSGATLVVYVDATGYLFPIEVFAASPDVAESIGQNHARSFVSSGDWRPDGALACVFVGQGEVSA